MFCTGVCGQVSPPPEKPLPSKVEKRDAGEARQVGEPKPKWSESEAKKSLADLRDGVQQSSSAVKKALNLLPNVQELVQEYQAREARGEIKAGAGLKAVDDVLETACDILQGLGDQCKEVQEGAPRILEGLKTQESIVRAYAESSTDDAMRLGAREELEKTRQVREKFDEEVRKLGKNRETLKEMQNDLFMRQSLLRMAMKNRMDAEELTEGLGKLNQGLEEMFAKYLQRSLSQ